jgi:hypothetical protein
MNERARDTKRMSIELKSKLLASVQRQTDQSPEKKKDIKINYVTF